MGIQEPREVSGLAESTRYTRSRTKGRGVSSASLVVESLEAEGEMPSVGAVKAWLRDDLVGERNRYAREVVKDMEGRQREAGRRAGGR